MTVSFPSDSGFDEAEKQKIREAVARVWDLVKTRFPDGAHDVQFKANDTMTAVARAPDARNVEVNTNKWSNQPSYIRASMIGHELVHVADWKKGVLVLCDIGTKACRNRLYESQSNAYGWQAANARAVGIPTQHLGHYAGHWRTEQEFFDACLEHETSACIEAAGRGPDQVAPAPPPPPPPPPPPSCEPGTNCQEP